MFKQFSPNMLKTFAQCPKKFYFKYVKNINMPVDDEIFEFGKNIHALASYYLKKQNIDKMEKSLTKRESDVWQYLKTIKYFSYEHVGTEYDLAVKIGDKYCGGRLDALVKNGDKYYILDYKTGSVPKDAKYDFQTMIYMLCVSEYFDTTDVEFVYVDLRNKTEICIKFSDELKNEYIEKIKQILGKIVSCEFRTSSKNGNCSCEYSKICF